MPRKKRGSLKRDIAPDPKYRDKMVSKFINYIMLEGKKSRAEQTFYKALDIIGSKTGEDSLDIFNKAFENVKPSIEVRSRRVGGATYQVPTEVRPDRRYILARRWIINAARARSEKIMSERLALELLDAYNNRGSAIKKKEDTHKMAEANKAFAHYRW
ncbi:MAG: 30S ribosomal protein S7 [Thermodesulfobacteriota bacterium]|nr:30S ribosomal protein S7 [Thermodesulfobacteriota bacterium]